MTPAICKACILLDAAKLQPMPHRYLRMFRALSMLIVAHKEAAAALDEHQLGGRFREELIAESSAALHNYCRAVEKVRFGVRARPHPYARHEVDISDIEDALAALHISESNVDAPAALHPPEPATAESDGPVNRAGASTGKVDEGAHHEISDTTEAMAFVKKYNLKPIRRQRAFYGALPGKSTYLPELTYERRHGLV